MGNESHINGKKVPLGFSMAGRITQEITRWGVREKTFNKQNVDV